MDDHCVMTSAWWAMMTRLASVMRGSDCTDTQCQVLPVGVVLNQRCVARSAEIASAIRESRLEELRALLDKEPGKYYRGAELGQSIRTGTAIKSRFCSRSRRGMVR